MDGYAAQPFDIAHEEKAFCALLTRNIAGLSPEAAQRKWASGYLANPAGGGFGMGLRHRERDAWVGALCLQERRWHFGNAVAPVLCLADFNVDAEHRSLGPALALMKAAIAEAEARGVAVYGFPNAAARGLVKRAGLSSLGRMQRFGKLLSLRFLGRKSLERAAPARAVLATFAPVLDPLLWVFDTLLRLLRGGGLHARTAAFGDAWIDEVWAHRDAGLQLSERSAAVVAWRYRSDLREGWRVARIDNRQGAPVGYVVWRLLNGIAEIGDVFCAHAPLDTTGALLALSGHARREGALAVSMEFFGHAGVATGVRRAGFLSRNTDDEILGRGAALSAWAEHGYLTGFDRDTH